VLPEREPKATPRRIDSDNLPDLGTSPAAATRSQKPCLDRHLVPASCRLDPTLFDAALGRGKNFAGQGAGQKSENLRQSSTCKFRREAVSFSGARSTEPLPPPPRLPPPPPPEPVMPSIVERSVRAQGP